MTYTFVGHSIISSLKCKIISNTFVSTDSIKYKKIAISYGAKVPFLRPLNFSQSNSTDFQVINHAINFLEKINLEFEYIVFLRPTTPQRSPNIINKAIKKFINSNFDSLRSVQEMSESSFKSFRKDGETLLPLIKKLKISIFQIIQDKVLKKHMLVMAISIYLENPT